MYASFSKASINASEEIRQPRHYYCHIIEILIKGNVALCFAKCFQTLLLVYVVTTSLAIVIGLVLKRCRSATECAVLNYHTVSRPGRNINSINCYVNIIC